MAELQGAPNPRGSQSPFDLESSFGQRCAAYPNAEEVVRIVLSLSTECNFFCMGLAKRIVAARYQDE